MISDMIDKVTWVDLEHSHFEVTILSELGVVGGASHVNNREELAFPHSHLVRCGVSPCVCCQRHQSTLVSHIYIYTVMSIRSSFNISKCQSECFHQV